MSLLHFVNKFLLFCAESWAVTLPILAFFVVFATLRLRQLRRLEQEQQFTLKRTEEETVLARRTLDFAHVGSEMRRERDEYHQMPSREELSSRQEASAPSHDEGLPEVIPAEGGGALEPLGDDGPGIEPMREAAPFEVGPEALSQVLTRSPALSLEEQYRRQEAILKEVLDGNRRVLEDLSHLVDPQAIEETELSLAEDPDNLRLLDWLAMLYFANDRIDKATEAYKKLISREPDSPDLFFFLGNCFFKANLLPEAQWCWARAATLDPSPRVREQLEEAQVKAQELVSAWEACGIYQPITDRFIEFLAEEEQQQAWQSPEGSVPGREAGMAAHEVLQVEAAASFQEEAPVSEVNPPEDSPQPALPVAATQPLQPDELPPPEVGVESFRALSASHHESDPAPPSAGDQPPDIPAEVPLPAVAGGDLGRRSPLSFAAPPPPEPRHRPEPEPEPGLEAEPAQDSGDEAQAWEGAASVVPPEPEPEMDWEPEPVHDLEPEPEPEPEGEEFDAATLEAAMAAASMAEESYVAVPTGPLDGGETARAAASSEAEILAVAEAMLAGDAAQAPSGPPGDLLQEPGYEPEPEREPEPEPEPDPEPEAASEPEPEPEPEVEPELEAEPAPAPEATLRVAAAPRAEVRFDEAEALQAAFETMFHPREGDPAVLLASLAQLEAAQARGEAATRLEFLEDPGGNVRVQTVYALAATQPEHLPVLLEAEDPELRLAAAVCLLFEASPPEPGPVLAALRADPTRRLVYLALLARLGEDELLPATLEQLHGEPLPDPVRAALWGLLVARASEAWGPLLEVALAGGDPAAAGALLEALGLAPLAEPFGSDPGDLEAGFDRARALLPGLPRIPRSLIRELGEGPGAAAWQALALEVQDYLLDSLGLDDASALAEALGPSRRRPLELLQVLAALDPAPGQAAVLPLALAAFLRLWNLEADPETPSEPRGLPGPEDLATARELLDDPAAPEHLVAAALVPLSRRGGDPVPLRGEPGYAEWYLHRRQGDDEVEALLAADPALGGAVLDRAGVVAAAGRLADLPEAAQAAPGLRAWQEALDAATRRPATPAPAPAAPEPPAREPAAVAPATPPSTRAPRPGRARRRAPRGGYSWSR